MHISHLPQALTLLLALTPTALALPDSRTQQIALDPASPEARQQRLEAWKAQKPMHTTALLAGAAATAIPKARIRDGRRRDLSSVTGEKGMWIPVEFWDDGDEKRGHKSGDVRGEKVLELELELEDEDVEVDVEVCGIRGMAVRVWRKLEEIGLLVQRKGRHMEEVKELDNGHDGDL